MGEITILGDLAVVIIAAGLAALVSEYLRQPKVLGYVLAGVLIGPHAFSLVHDRATVQTLADIGIMFLMFSLGLEFNLRKLRRVGTTALIMAGLDVAVMLWIGYEIGRAMGLGSIESAFLGAILCDSSTTVLTKVLKDLGRERDAFAPIVFGATIVEDILAIVLIAILTGSGSGASLLTGTVLIRMAKLSVFLVVLVIIGLLAIPRLLVHVAGFRNEELLVISVLALCFGVSLLAVRLDFSLALGAFLIGAITAESRLIGRIELLMAPLRLMFGAAFFISAGLLVDPALLLRHLPAIVAVTLVVIAGKTVNCTVGAFLAGHGARDSFKAGLGMAQVCEFAFIIATLGLSTGAVSLPLYQVAVGVAILTLMANPFLLRHADALADRAGRWVPEPVRRNMDLYAEGVRRMLARYTDNAVRKVVRRSLWLVAVNLAFIAAIFIGAGYIARHSPGFLPVSPGGRRAILWAAALLVSLPFYVATARKLNALGMIFAELVTPAAAAQGLRSFVAALMLFAGIAGLALVTFLLSSALLPSRHVVIATVALVAAATWLGWRHLVTLYGRVQSALRETFARELPPPKPHGVPAMIGALMDEDLEAVRLPDGAAAVGRTIQEISLRTQTGATIVSLERRGQTLLNPDAGFRFEAGDRILLLGSGDQTEAARKILIGEPAS